MIERNYYLEKLRKIEKIGEENDWEDKDQLLNQIKTYFDSIENN